MHSIQKIKAMTAFAVLRLWDQYEEAVADWDDYGVAFDPDVCVRKLLEIKLKAADMKAHELIAEIERAEDDLKPIQALVKANKLKDRTQCF